MKLWALSCRVTQDGWLMVESYNEMWSTGVWVSEVCCLVQLFATPWTVAHQVPLSMGFFRQEYWSGLPLSSPRNLLTQGLNLGLLHCRQTFFFNHLNHQGISLEKEMANHFSILAMRTHEQYEKAKRNNTESWTPQVGRCPICYWRRVEK